MTHPEAVRYLGSFLNYERSLSVFQRDDFKLKRIEKVLSLLGRPQDATLFIQVAGTKGKGSTCAFLAYILRSAGYKTGLYTSPHFYDLRERLRILASKDKTDKNNNAQVFVGMIPKEELADLTTAIKPAIDNYNRDNPDDPLTFFEAYTILALLYFKKQRVDIAVLEAGLGGRLDATNVVKPKAAIITPISYDHTCLLGDTLAEIAFEKAGIIKPITGSLKQRPVVISAKQKEEAAVVIREQAEQAGAELYEAENDFTCYIGQGEFDVRGINSTYKNLKIKLTGRHQVENASLAVACAEKLAESGFSINESQIRQGLYDAKWPGRCELVRSKPRVVLDGAQNKASAAALKTAIRDNFRWRRLIVIFGISKDKDIKGTSEEFADFADTIILTASLNPRASAPEELAGYFSGKEAVLTKNIKQAKEKAFAIAGEDDLIVITGSLFLVAEARELFLS